MRNKRIIGLLLVLFIVIAVPGCKGDGSITNKGSESTNNGDLTNVEITEVTEEMVRNYKTASASDFTYANLGDCIAIRGYNGDDPIVVIPDTIEGLPVAEIKAYVFGTDSSVKGVYIPKTVKEMRNVFVANDDIQVVICEGVERLLGYTFSMCVNLRTVDLSDNLIELGDSEFYMCESLKELYIPSTLTSIKSSYAEALFCGADNLTIVGEAGSYIESFAEEQGIPFKARENE